MRFNDSFHNGFNDELQKTAALPLIGAALAAAPTIARIGKGILGAGKAVGTAAKVVGSGAKTRGSGLYSKLKGAAGSAVPYAPSFMGGGGQPPKRNTNYVR